jgi:hypothetical protein
MLRILRHLHSERGQILPMFVMLLVSFLALVGLAIDAGRVYVARAELTRALDAAALAGVIELPDVDAAKGRATAYMDENQADATLTFPAAGENQFRVKGVRNVDLLFMRIVGFRDLDITASAAAGFGIIPSDNVLLIDATKSMHNGGTGAGCNSTETNGGGDCPIKEAKDAANQFVDTLLGATPDGMTLVGAAAFRGCYDPPRVNTKCIKASGAGSMVTFLSSNTTALQNGINAIYAISGPGQPTGGSGTNVCQALKKGEEILTGAGHHTAANTLRSVVILSDGDNVYNAGEVNQSSPVSVHPDCRPSSPSTDQGDLSANCRTDTQTQEGKVDLLTLEKAKDMKAAGYEIYVIAFDTCGNNSTVYTSAQCDSQVGQTGSSHPDSTADQRLLKCVASSTAGTNDHYYYVQEAANLPQVFQDIANTIAFRLIE